MASQNGAPVVAQTYKFKTPAEATAYISKMRGRYRKIDEFSGKPLYRNNVGIVFRDEGDGTVSILSNCVC